MPERKLTIRDIARLAGVSRSTVSLVLNNDRRISEVTRTRVQSIIQGAGYEPNAIARGLAHRAKAVAVDAASAGSADVVALAAVLGIALRVHALAVAIRQRLVGAGAQLVLTERAAEARGGARAAVARVVAEIAAGAVAPAEAVHQAVLAIVHELAALGEVVRQVAGIAIALESAGEVAAEAVAAIKGRALVDGP